MHQFLEHLLSSILTCSPTSSQQRSASVVSRPRKNVQWVEPPYQAFLDRRKRRYNGAYTFLMLELWRLTIPRCYLPQFSDNDGIQCSFSGLANFSTSVTLHGQYRASDDVALWVQRYLLDVS
jgi:hypothetical protein